MISPSAAFCNWWRSIDWKPVPAVRSTRRVGAMTRAAVCILVWLAGAPLSDGASAAPVTVEMTAGLTSACHYVGAVLTCASSDARIPFSLTFDDQFTTTGDLSEFVAISYSVNLPTLANPFGGPTTTTHDGLAEVRQTVPGSTVVESTLSVAIAEAFDSFTCDANGNCIERHWTTRFHLSSQGCCSFLPSGTPSAPTAADIVFWLTGNRVSADVPLPPPTAISFSYISEAYELFLSASGERTFQYVPGSVEYRGTVPEPGVAGTLMLAAIAAALRRFGARPRSIPRQ